MNTPSYVFTTGAYIAPKYIDGQWVWVVVEFDGDTFGDGQPMNPTETATTLEELYAQAEAVCEVCGNPCEYDSEICLCEDHDDSHNE